MRNRAIPTALLVLAAFLLTALGTSCGTTSASQEERIKRVENGILKSIQIKGEPVEQMTVAARLAHHKVPGVSIAVIEGFEVVWAKGYGIRDTEENAPVTAGTLFQAASISKPVAAAAALRFVEKGVLSLNGDVNDKLLSWKVPENEFTAKQKVTLRRILSHSAGLTVHGFRGYPGGAPFPTLLQVLDGQKPANSAPIRVDILPGSRWRYSGGGFTVMQQLLIDVAGKPFPEVMKENVLGPAGMTRSTYEQPLPEGRLPEAAVGYRTSGAPVEGKRHVYPEMAAAGLWTTPTDLCRFAVEIMKAWNGTSNKILSRDMAVQMLTAQSPPSGLGLILAGQEESLEFNHGGSNEGFRCGLIAFPIKGLGAAVMTNSDNGGRLIPEILNAISKEYSWPAYRPTEKAIATLAPETLDAYVGKYELGPGYVVTVSRKNGHLLGEVAGEDSPLELFPEAEARFFATGSDTEIAFLKDRDGKVTGFMLNQSMRAKKIG